MTDKNKTTLGKIADEASKLNAWLEQFERARELESRKTGEYPETVIFNEREWKILQDGIADLEAAIREANGETIEELPI